MHGFVWAGIFLLLAFISLVSSMTFWFRDIISEATYLGNHTLAVQRGLNMGVALFIVSEALFFLAIFWAFFHSALSPTVELGAQWPPMGIEAINPFELPLLNTVILLSSGVSITYAHHSLIQGDRKGALYGTVYTVILALIFTSFQGVEYSVSSFTISDGAFGSCFYFGTGLSVAPIIFIEDVHKLSPYWITGFCDGESYFSVKIGADKTRKLGIRIIPTFGIELHKRHKAILEMFMKYFGVGTVTERVRDGKPKSIYTVQTLSEIVNVIIPHFVKYPLISQKKADFLLFNAIVEILNNIETKNLKIEHVREILSLKGSMGKSKSLSNKLNILFPNIVLANRAPVVIIDIPSPFWLAGFVSAEGMFYIKPVKKSGLITTFKLLFTISQHERDIALMNVILAYLKCGYVENKPSRPHESCYVVTGHVNISSIIIPFFEKHHIMGVKSLDFSDFCKASVLINNKAHLTKKGKQEILKIKAGMNTKRK